MDCSECRTPGKKSCPFLLGHICVSKMRPRPVMLVAISTILVFSILVDASDTFGKGQSLPVVMSKQYGYGLQQSREGIPVLITRTFLNTDEIARNITVIFDIRKDDVTFYLALKDETALPRSGTDTLVSWTPQVAGEYQIRSFAVSNLTSPEVLEDVAASKFNVMSNDDFVALYADRPTSFPNESIDPVAASPSTLGIKLSEKQNLGSGLNMGIGDIAVSDNGLYVVGASQVPLIGESPSTDVLNDLVYFIASNDRGLTFEPMRYLVNNTQALTLTGRTLVRAVNDTFHYVSWLQQDYYKDKFKLVVSKSLDGGKTLADTISLDYGGVILGDLDMVVSDDGKSLYIVRTEVYHDYGPGLSTIVFSKSTDYAGSFSSNHVIANHTGNDEIRCPQIEAQEADGDSDYNKIYVTWQNYEDKIMKLFFTASYDNGATFSPAVVIREAYTEDYDCPTFFSHGDDVYLSWAETKLIYKPEDPSEILADDTDIFFAASRDSGRSFGPPVNLSEGIGAYTMEPAILVSDGRIYAAWRDTISEVNDEGGVNFYGNAEVIMTRSFDGGRTFEKPVNLSNNPTGSYAPEIAVHADNVYVIWMESTFPSNEAKVSLRISGDGGRTFGATAENIVGLISEPFSRPRVLNSPDGEQIYIIWSEIQANEGTVNIYASTGVPLE